MTFTISPLWRNNNSLSWLLGFSFVNYFAKLSWFEWNILHFWFNKGKVLPFSSMASKDLLKFGLRTRKQNVVTGNQPRAIFSVHYLAGSSKSSLASSAKHLTIKFNEIECPWLPALGLVDSQTFFFVCWFAERQNLISTLIGLGELRSYNTWNEVPDLQFSNLSSCLLNTEINLIIVLSALICLLARSRF